MASDISQTTNSPNIQEKCWSKQDPKATHRDPINLGIENIFATKFYPFCCQIHEFTKNEHSGMVMGTKQPL